MVYNLSLLILGGLLLLNFLSLISPHLAVRRTRPVLAFVIFFGDLAPVSGKHSAARRLVALHHGPASIFIRSLVDLLEQAIEGSLALWLFGFQFLFEICVNLVPVFTGCVGTLTLGNRLLDGDRGSGH